MRRIAYNSPRQSFLSEDTPHVDDRRSCHSERPVAAAAAADLFLALGKPSNPFTESGVMWRTIIHGLFVLSALRVAYLERLNQMAMAQACH